MKSTTVDALDALRAHIAKHGTQAKAAAALGMSQQLLSQVLNQKLGFSDVLLDKLGLKRQVVRK